jgi:hypothetical protein
VSSFLRLLGLNVTFISEMLWLEEFDLMRLYQVMKEQ